MGQRNTTPTTTSWTTLATRSTRELRAKWVAVFGTAAAPQLRRELLIFALGHALQARALGGLAARTRRTLIEMAAGQAAADRHVRRALAPGTQLVREWHGQTHVVEVAESGYYFAGEHYASLSAIARRITGTRWSGPRFFGLDDAARAP